MAQEAQQEEQGHWKDRAITASEAISDAFDVAKAYGAHIANWVLFFCLVANLVEMVSPDLQAFAGLAIVGVQSISLDIAGFGLTAMAASAKRRGDEKSARKANAMGWMLITVMAITVGLITLAAFKPEWALGIQEANQGLMFVRVIVTVFYGHIVHQLREESASHENRLKELETEVSTLQGQLQAKQQEVSTVQQTKQQEVSTVQLKLSTVQSQVSTLQEQLDGAKQEVSSVQRKLDAEQQKVSILEEELATGQGDTAGLHRELNAAKIELEGLRGRLSAKVREVEETQADLSNVVTLRRELNAAQLASEEVRGQLQSKARELEGVQSRLSGEQQEASKLRNQLSSEQKRVSTLQAQLDTIHQQRVSTGQAQVSSNLGTQVSTGQQNKEAGQQQKGDTGQEKIVTLDTRRRTPRQTAMAVRQLMVDHKGITGRDIARQLPCSPTTANEWKKFFDDGGTLEQLYPEGEAVNE